MPIHIVKMPESAYHTYSYGSGGKAHNMGELFDRILDLFRLEGRDVMLVIGYSVASGIVALTVPIATSSLVNMVAFGVLKQPVVVLTFLVVLALSFTGFLKVVQTWMVEMIQRRLIMRVAVYMAHKWPRADDRSEDEIYLPEKANRYFEAISLEKSMSVLLTEGVPSVLNMIIGATIIAIYHPFFIIFDVALFGLGGYLIMYKMGKPALRAALKMSSEKYRIAAWLENIAHFRNTFRPTVANRYAIEEHEAILTDYIGARETHFRHFLRQVIAQVGLRALLAGFVLGVGGFLVIERQLTIGQLVAAQYIAMTLLYDLNLFSKYIDAFYDTATAVSKISEVGDIPERENTGSEIPDWTGPVGVEISHGRKKLLRAAAGKVTLIPGGSGSVSHLLDLVAGLRTDNDGIVTVGGNNLRDIHPSIVADSVILLREIELFSGTLSENLRAGGWVTYDNLLSTLESVGLGGDAAHPGHPDLQMELVTGGRPLSFSARRQVMIARALLAQPKVLLVDEILDGIEDEILRKILKTLEKSGITVIIATEDRRIQSWTGRGRRT